MRGTAKEALSLLDAGETEKEQSGITILVLDFDNNYSLCQMGATLIGK